ncbi:alternative ribosome-rescue factor A [Vibrio metoecus]|uniref:alternative ribosome-rescue factor A n=1 Tax=Vibrio metoecus TaxID=1481663 RepID=UPI000BA93078|nr:ribosome alternative rescue factor ArfA [Vibrio metoecus]PAR48369.1 ribosome alternative rescue factor ArfA [Vibrio metoecus]
MREKTVVKAVTQAVMDTECGRGTIQDSALKAVVTSTLFRCRTEKAKKGKGSYSRKMKFKGKECYPKTMNTIVFG